MPVILLNLKKLALFLPLLLYVWFRRNTANFWGDLMGVEAKVIRIGAVLMLNAVSCAMPAFAQVASSCAIVYEGNLAEIANANSRSAQASFLYDHYCDATGSTREGALSGGIEVFEVLGADLNFSGSSEEVRRFCSTSFEARQIEGASFSSTYSPVYEAMQSFNACVAIENQFGYRITHTTNHPFGVVINGSSLGVATPVEVNALNYPTDLLTCESGSFSEDGETINLDQFSNVTAPTGSFAISCERIPVPLESGNTFLPSVTLTISTDRISSSYPISLASEIRYNFDLASQAVAAYDAVQRELEDSRVNALGLQTRLDGAAARYESISSLMLSIYDGDGSAHGFGPTGSINVGITQPDLSYGCEDQYELRNQCPNGYRAVGVDQVISISGGQCGHNYFSVSCVPVEQWR
ncbi:hypothetical protein [Gymnodinialimonas sp. 57CJ19]|uniref:hypothetical protein n=1 Tax=Gymnodinialimonas sp. 57CJ19 TaxID=3138498 RepID=UPI00313460C3